MKTIAAIVFAGLVSGCTLLPDKITAGAPTLTINSPTVVTDLQSAAYNLDSAVTIGALATDDPAPKCLHNVLVKAGIEVLPGAEPAKSFAPKKDGVASAGAIAYILVQQAKNAKPLTVSVECEALVGRIVIDGVGAMKKAVPAVIGALH